MNGNKFINLAALPRRQTKGGGGFSLIEILVVLGIFSVLAIVIVNVFLLALRSQRQASFRQETVANLRYVTETMVRQIRNSEIDFGSPGDGKYDNDILLDGGKAGIVGSESELYLVDQENNTLAYYLQGGELKIQINGQVASLTDLNDIQVIKLLFFISPVADPFSEERCNQDSGPTGCSIPSVDVGGCTINDPTGFPVGFCRCDTSDDCLKTQYCDSTQNLCLPFNQQPRVTIVLGFRSTGTRVEEQKTVYLQTTVSGRVYKR